MVIRLVRRKNPMYGVNRDRHAIVKAFHGHLIGIGQSLLAIATETEKTAENFNRDKSALDDGGRYYRFNVIKGLEEVGLEDSARKNMIAGTCARITRVRTG